MFSRPLKSKTMLFRKYTLIISDKLFFRRFGSTFKISPLPPYWRKSCEKSLKINFSISKVVKIFLEKQIQSLLFHSDYVTLSKIN